MPLNNPKPCYGHPERCVTGAKATIYCYNDYWNVPGVDNFHRPGCAVSSRIKVLGLGPLEVPMTDPMQSSRTDTVNWGFKDGSQNDILGTSPTTKTKAAKAMAQDAATTQTIKVMTTSSVKNLFSGNDQTNHNCRRSNCIRCNIQKNYNSGKRDKNCPESRETECQMLQESERRQRKCFGGF